jgi:tripartite-type tricarboxylate transporter receptor subunit TctC
MKPSRFAFLAFCAVFVFVAVHVCPAQSAEDFPTKYITVICGFSAGGSTDVQMRGIIPYLQKYLGKGVVVENQTGANGIIAYNASFAAAPDGYTLLVTSIPAQTIAEKYFPDNAKFQSRNYSHIYAFVKDELILVGHPEMYKSFQDLLQASKRSKVKVGISGKGQPTHLAAAMLEDVGKMQVNVIPFEGGSESLASLAGKHIDAVVTLNSAASNLIKSGVLKPLLVLDDRRFAAYGDTLCAKEVGLDISVPYITGVMGPPKIPAERVKILETAFGKAVDDPDYVKWAKNMNIEITHMPSSEFLKETIKDYGLVEEYMKVLK